MSDMLKPDEMQQARDERTLEAHLKRFHERWAPHNEQYDDQWFTEFHMLMRHIYRDAQEPFTKAMADAMMRAPMAPIIMKNDLGR